MARRISIVPHTHWDREWYSSFQTFRLRLLDLLDEFLPDLETDLSYARFLLDGQMAVVDDYLQVRPDQEPRLRRLAASGRLAMGPWYILMDEFLVSAETIVRNLQLGLERAAAFNGAMPVGYLPDMFGHIAQMPQILRQAGLDHAVVWRGVPSAIDKTAFWWTAPDGSTVRAEYLVVGYGNGAAIPDDAKALIRRIRTHEDELASFWLGPILFMNGTDHQVPQRWLGRVVAEANDAQDDYHLEVTSLPEYLSTAPTDGLPAWTGELRSGARANLLMGVSSNRVDIKQAAARTERALERLAEPLAALFMPADRWPGAILDVAWQDVIRNSAHDSICACSIDEVCDAVTHRFAEARQIAEGVTTRSLRSLGRSMAEPGPYVLNPSHRTRGGLIELTVAGAEAPAGAQVLAERPSVLADVTMKGRELGGLLGQIRSQQFDESTYINKVDVQETEDGLDIVLHADSVLRAELVVEEIKRDLYAKAGANPEMTVHARIEQPPSRTLLVHSADVPGYGWRRWTGGASGVEPVSVPSGTTMTNGLVTVDVDRATGAFAIDGLPGFDRLVDEGDHGDTYNYSPPETDTAVDEPEAVAVDVTERGPMRARLVVRRTYRWPERIDNARRARVGQRMVVVRTELEVQAGQPYVRVRTTFDNPCRDHRLRAIFPLPVPASESRAECAFAVVTRGLEAEGGVTERGLPTYPSRRFVQAGGLTVVHEGLLEYELIGIGAQGANALALTLVRATGMLSRVEMAYRPLPAGPPIPMEGPQMIGPVGVQYALTTTAVDPYAMVDDVFLPLMRVDAAGGGERPPAGQALAITGAEVSALRRAGDGLEVRVFNPSDGPATVTIGAHRGWLVDLRGRPVEPFDGTFDLAPWAIATARLSG